MFDWLRPQLIPTLVAQQRRNPPGPRRGQRPRSRRLHPVRAGRPVGAGRHAADDREHGAFGARAQGADQEPGDCSSGSVIRWPRWECSWRCSRCAASTCWPTSGGSDRQHAAVLDHAGAGDRHRRPDDAGRHRQPAGRVDSAVAVRHDGFDRLSPGVGTAVFGRAGLGGGGVDRPGIA